MLKFVPVLLGALALAGCSTLSDASLENTVCSHQIITTQAAELALSNAQLIKDPAAQAAAIAAANASLSLVAGCPGYDGPAVE